MYTRMPFGCKNASAKFQRIMDYEIGVAEMRHCCKTFIDDVLIHSATPEEHLEHLTKLFKMLRRTNLKAHPEKSTFGSEVVEYLGHNLSRYGTTDSTSG